MRGIIRATEPWIVVDQTLFDGMSTRVNVRINSTQLPGLTHYTGTILVSLEDEEIDILVAIEVDVLSLGVQENWRRGSEVDLNNEDEFIIDDTKRIVSDKNTIQVKRQSIGEDLQGGIIGLIRKIFRREV